MNATVAISYQMNAALLFVQMNAASAAVVSYQWAHPMNAAC